jgi:hypothetical protein
MKKILIMLTFVLAIIGLNAQETFLEFDFTPESLNANYGTGVVTATVFGESQQITLGFAAGLSGTRALNTSQYPANASGEGPFNELAGIEIMVSTVGRTNIQIEWSNRNSNTAANRLRLQYTLNGGTNWNNFLATDDNALNFRGTQNPIEGGFDNGLYIMPEGEQFYNRQADFSAITDVNNNPNFGVRFVSSRPTGSNVYVPSGPGNYGANGTIRYNHIHFLHTSETRVITPIAKPGGGVFTETTLVALSTATEEASIYYTVDGTYPTTSSFLYLQNPIEISETTTLRFFAVKEGLDPSVIVTANYVFPETVTNIAALRAKTVENPPPAVLPIYSIPGEVILTHFISNRNQKFIQDATGAILIDDPAGILMTPYAVGDAIVGLSGTLSIFNTMLQFTPVGDPGSPVSSDNPIPVVRLTIGQILANPLVHQARYVGIHDVEFTGSAGNFVQLQAYNMTDGTGSFAFRTIWTNADYIDQPRPTGTFSMRGIVQQNAQGPFITARSSADLNVVSDSDKVASTRHKLLGNYPNPFNPTTSISFHVSESTTESFNTVTIDIYNIRGQKIHTLVDGLYESGEYSVVWNGLDDNGSSVGSGVYLYKMTTSQTTETRKMILIK